MEFTFKSPALFWLRFFGAGFLAARLDKRVWKISATSRDAEGIAEIDAQGFRGLPFDSTLQIAPDTDASADFGSAR